jgi:hypothetical protein
MRALLTGTALLVLAPVSVYVSYQGKLDEQRRGLPTEVRRVAAGTAASYGPAQWRLDWQRTTDVLRTAKYDAQAPPAGRWVLARISYHAGSALPDKVWCEVSFTDRAGRRFEAEFGTTIDGRTSLCYGDQDAGPSQRPRPDADFSFVVAALVPKDATEPRARVTIRTELPAVLEFTPPG